MTEQKQEQSSIESTISVEEIQKTIKMKVRDGKIKPEVVQHFLNPQFSTRIIRNTSITIRKGLARFRYLFHSSSPQSIPIRATGENSDSIPPLNDIASVNLEDLHLGLIDDDFEREGLIASGGQADIINAKDKQVGRLVAVKCLRDSYKESPGVTSDLIQEAVLTARLEHPAITPVYRLCRDHGNNLHIVMKKIRGKTFAKFLDETRIDYNRSKIHIFEERASLSRRLDVFLDICNGLGYAHSLKVVHCDLKPENIMIGHHHETYIIDWGIARVLENGVVPGAKQITGTPHYIAPEIIFGMDYDLRADIFAMGVILFEIVTLQKAFPGKEPKEILENICVGNRNPVKHLHGIGIDKALIHIIRKATEVYPEARYQKIEDLAEDIRRYRSGLEILAKPDNIFQYACRWMLIHKRLTRWIIQISLAVILAYVGFNTYEKMQMELLQKRRETALNDAYTKSLMVSMEINNQLNKAEQIVSILASEAAFILDHHPYNPEKAPKTTKTDNALLPHPEMKGENTPKTSPLSTHYNSRIDFSDLSYINSGKIPKQELEHYRMSLLPFKRQIIGFFILSNTDKNPYAGQEANRPENMEKSNFSLSWLHFNFANGLHLRYPASESFVEDFDGRQQPWYIRAEANPNKVIWEQPQLDPVIGNKVILTAAKAIASHPQKFLGVAGVDMDLDEIRRIIEKDQTDRYFKKMILLSDGRILINTANPTFQPKNDKNGKLILPQFHHQGLFQRMTRKQYGFESIRENGRETFYIYTYLEQMKWYYVVRVDQDNIQIQSQQKKGRPEI